MAKQPPIDVLLQWYERMNLIRAFESHAIDSFRKGMFSGSTHPCIGQEAIAVGGAAALRPTDQVFATYRGHGHALAKGLTPRSVMAELLCKSPGCCKGRGGSMHLCDVDRNFWGTNAIVAAHIPIAGGMALSNKLRGDDRVTVVYFGDGASCEGAFFETLNMASLWKVPLVLVCENNGFAISVPTRMAVPNEDVAARAKGFNLPAVVTDGNDPQAVHQAVSQAVDHARSGQGPMLVECKTTRWERHSAISAGKYADDDAALAWKRVDPIPRFARWLLEAGVTQEQLTELSRRAQQVADDALQFAIESEPPALSAVEEYVFA